MSSLISFNSTNIVDNSFNNILRYDLPGSSVNFVNSEVAIHSINLYNSQFNIDSVAYQNHTFSISIPSAATFYIHSIVLPDGYYSYSDINRLIQTKLIALGAYLIDANGDNVFHIQLSSNETYYAAQLDLARVPTTIPSGFSRPATGIYSTTGTGLPSTSYTPKLTIDNVEFGKILGFENGVYPPTSSTSDKSYLSTIIPQIAPSSSYMLRCSLIRNPFSMPPDVLTTFSSKGTTIGQQIAYSPNEYSFMDIPNGSYASIQLTIVDQLERFPKFRDSNMLITLIVRPKKV